METNGSERTKTKSSAQKKSKALLMNIEEIIGKIEQLPLDEKLLLKKRLLGEYAGLTVVFNGNGNGNSNIIQSSLVIQTSDSQEMSEHLFEKIKNISPEVLDDLLIAIATQIKSRSEAHHTEVSP